ncbi:MAG TPA: helix-turn-helix domain-containing protein [Gemmatimonadales bacterium]|nr:helix-turn-helix domain-containing protein [Gemmatimonadales bacterium]
MDRRLDLTPFGFTPTESRVYAVLLETGPVSGYEVARRARLARANAYGALDGLVSRSAAVKLPGKPARYRPIDPDALLAQVATTQGQALETLGQALAQVGHGREPETRPLEGFRPTANVILQAVGRAAQTVRGVIAPELLRATLPAWRRAMEKTSVSLATFDGSIAGDIASFATVRAPADFPTLLIIDDRQVITVIPSAAGERGIWSTHPALLALARRALDALG